MINLLGIVNPIYFMSTSCLQHSFLKNREAKQREAGSSFYKVGIIVLILFPVSTISSTNMTCLPFIDYFKPIKLFTSPD